MTSSKLAMVLFGGLAVLLFLLSRALERDYESRTPEFLMDMADSPAYEAQEPNPILPGGRTMQLPPEGSVARGFEPYLITPGKDGIEEAGRELRGPTLDPLHDLARGEAVYGRICAVCHGPSGEGDAEVTKRGVPPPPSLLAEQARKLSDGAIYHIISTGYNNMPAHAAQVTRADRWRVIGHLRAMQEAAQ